jgi:hypothetical protein
MLLTMGDIMKWKSPLLFGFILLAVALPSDGHSQEVQRIQIESFGIYSAGKVETQTARGNFGRKYKSKKTSLIKQTTRVPVKRGLIFGFKYKLVGRPNGAKVQLLKKVIHPPMRNPDTGRTFTVTESRLTKKIGKTEMTGWSFRLEWAMVPGTYTVQIFHKGHVLAQKRFTAYRP